MTGPRAAALLDAWDAGTTATSAERALLLLGTIRPEPVAQLAAMPLGWVAAELLRLRAHVIGPVLACLANCPQCDAIVESQIPVEQLTAGSPALTPGPDMPPVHRLGAEDLEIEFRLPTPKDLLALRGDTGGAAELLAQAITMRGSEEELGPAAMPWPSGLRGRLERAVLELDPLAFIALDIACPSCGHAWTEPLDVTEFVWAEISRHAGDLIAQVARLADAFAWREADILEMSERRRRRYLDLLPS